MLSFLMATLFSCLSFNVQAKEFNYENYSNMNGMVSNYIECFLHDSDGFLWVGTWNGLNRFDGYNFRQYEASVYVKGMLSGNWVRCLHEDKSGNLWVGTNNGLSKYDKVIDQFDNYHNFFNSVNVYDIKDAGDNKLWIASNTGLYLFDPVAKKIDKHYANESENPKWIVPCSFIYAIEVDKNQQIWVATIDQGLVKINAKTDEFEVFRHNSGKNSIASDYLRTLTLDKQGNLWIGTTDNGVSILNTKEMTFSTKKNEIGNDNSLGSNTIADIICDRNGIIWVACENGYLNKYDPKKGSFVRYVNQKYTMREPFPISVQTIGEDNVGNIWAGTLGDGIFCLNQYTNQFRTFNSFEDGKTNIMAKRILSFAETEDGNIMIGSDGNGICIFNPQNEKVNFVNKNSGLPTDAITSIQKISDKEYWISTWRGGVSIYNYLDKRVISYPEFPINNKELENKEIKCLLKDNDKLWLATNGSGIYLVKNIGNRTQLYKDKDKGAPFDLSAPKWCNALHKDKKGRLWMTTYFRLYMYDGKKLHTYGYENGNPKSIGSDQTFSLMEDSKNNIWIITNRGLVKYEEDDSFINYSEKYGLPKDVRSVVEDDNKNLWISTGIGLTRFNPSTKKVTNFSKDEGLGENDYSFNAGFKTKSGKILFGGIYGFVMFDPDSLMSSPYVPRVVIENLYMDYERQEMKDSTSVLKKSIETTDTLYLDYSNAVISFDFAGLDFSNPKALLYSYQLKGLNNNWISLGKDRKITLSNLSPGTYVLLIKATKPDGVYGTNGDGLIIKVRPPWWMTWWFYLGIGIIGVIGIFILFKYRVRQIQKRNRKLEATVEMRTSELTEKNKELSELNNTKDKFFSIIAHDLRNPINVLMGVAELLIERFDTMKEENKKDYINRIFDSSKNIHALLEQLLNWATSQSHTLHFDWQDTDINRILSEAITLENEMAFKKNIAIETDLKATRTVHQVDPLMISTVMRNLISNAIKFTYENGTIKISTEEKDNHILIAISDNGIGMSAEQLEKLFSIKRGQSRLGTNNEKGTGLGLVICKDFIEKNNGTLTVESEPGKGSTFFCSFPAGDVILTNNMEANSSEVDRSDTKENNFATDILEVNGAEKPILLIVEDNQDIAQYVNDIFASNFDVKIAENGKIGWQKCKEQIPDIIISDVTMPEMDGEELCRLVKTDALTNHIPLILLTARNLPQQQITGLQKGADDYITKPFNKQVLQERVRTLLKNRALYKDYIKRQMICEPDLQMPTAPSDKFLEDVVSIIEKNLSDPQLSVEFIAQEIGVSRVQLYRKFKALTGQSPIDMIKDIKIKKAASLLKTGEWKIADAAFESGFSDPLYFSKCFQKEFEMTPSQYIKENAPDKGKNVEEKEE